MCSLREAIEQDSNFELEFEAMEEIAHQRGYRSTIHMYDDMLSAKELQELIAHSYHDELD